MEWNKGEEKERDASGGKGGEGIGTAKGWKGGEDFSVSLNPYHNPIYINIKDFQLLPYVDISLIEIFCASLYKAHVNICL